MLRCAQHENAIYSEMLRYGQRDNAVLREEL
jgi:hypothetical protein